MAYITTGPLQVVAGHKIKIAPDLLKRFGDKVKKSTKGFVSVLDKITLKAGIEIEFANGPAKYMLPLLEDLDGNEVEAEASQDEPEAETDEPEAKGA